MTESKTYNWEPTASFTLTGIEYGMTLNYLRKRKADLLRELDILKIFEAKLEEGITNGTITESSG